MKVLAIVDVAPGASVERIRAELGLELKESWQLFEAGVLREAYATSSPTRVVFVLETDDARAADGHLRRLPLVAAGLFDVQCIELRPFVNWSRLFAT
jgi:hypothetical protein